MDKGRRRIVDPVRSAWTGADPSIRQIAVTVWLSGIFVALTGIAGDAWRWWSDWPFVTNLLSSAAGALIGIPVALFVIQQLATAQAESIVSRRERRTALELTLQLKANAERVVPGIFADFGSMYGYRASAERIVGLLSEIRKPMAEGRELAPELRGRLEDAIREHRGFSSLFFDLERIPSEARGIWSALRPYLLTISHDAPAAGYLDMVGVVDAELEAVSRATSIGYRQIEELWSNSLPGENQSPGKLTLDLRGVDQRLDAMNRVNRYLEALEGLYASLDGITTRLASELGDALSPASRGS
ncbi:hypothetical protein ABZ814_30730 [Micromonospora musae]|uniref:hypothetical protein n=1 Tax=Micromonospora musae TaxID=1894970 RepID=UPI0033C474BB